MKLNSFAVTGLLAAILLGLSGCSTVPGTGRSQLILMSSSEEMQMGLSAFQDIKKEEKISQDPQLNALVQRVGQRIAAVAPMPDAQWEFVVFESEQANAFCLPGGKVGIYTGILPITRTEAGLATVMGHEVAHAVARHGAERVSESMLLQGGGTLLGATLSNADPRTQAAWSTAYGLGSQLGRSLPHSRKQESEADHLGLMYMARAGYDPGESVAFWQRFAAYNQQAGSSTPWFLRTHPLDEKRIQDLQALLPQARQEYRPR